MVFTLTNIMQRFERRGSRAQNNGDLLAVRAIDGQIAGVIPPAFLLLIRAVVFFINDDDAKILNGVNSDERVPITIAASPFSLSAGR